MEVARIVDGDTAGLEPELVGVVLVLLQGPVDRVDVVLRLPLGIRVHDYLEVGIVLVIVIDGFDDRAQGQRTLWFSLLVSRKIALQMVTHGSNAPVQSLEPAVVDIDLIPEEFLELTIVLLSSDQLSCKSGPPLIRVLARCLRVRSLEVSHDDLTPVDEVPVG